MRKGMDLGEDGASEGRGVAHEVEEGFVMLDGGNKVIGLELRTREERLLMTRLNLAGQKCMNKA